MLKAKIIAFLVLRNHTKKRESYLNCMRKEKVSEFGGNLMLLKRKDLFCTVRERAEIGSNQKYIYIYLNLIQIRRLAAGLPWSQSI